LERRSCKFVNAMAISKSVSGGDIVAREVIKKLLII
jgi:hypothetical protein